MRVVAAVVVALALAVAAEEIAINRKVVATGLNSPRGLSFDSRGNLYVAESGLGLGRDPVDGDFAYDGPEGTTYFGNTGSITRVKRVNSRRRSQERIVSGLPSSALAGNVNANGPAAVDFTMGRVGLFQSGSFPIPKTGGGFEEALGFNGTTSKLSRDGTMRPLGSVTEYALTTDGVTESNPQGIAFINYRNPTVAAVADAGANAIYMVTNKRVSKVVSIPNVQYSEPVVLPFGTFNGAQAVPTSVRVGPDGFLYVSLLTGFPYKAGSASILKIDADTGDITTHATGFTNLIDLFFDPDTDVLYALEISSAGLIAPQPAGSMGAVVRVNGDGSTTSVVTGLILPGGLTIRNGFFYISNCGTLPGVVAGPVRRVRRDTYAVQDACNGGEVIRVPVPVVA